MLFYDNFSLVYENKTYLNLNFFNKFFKLIQIMFKAFKKLALFLLNIMISFFKLFYKKNRVDFENDINNLMDDTTLNQSHESS